MKPGLHILEGNRSIPYKGNEELVTSIMYYGSIQKRIDDKIDVNHCEVDGCFIYFNGFTISFFVSFIKKDKQCEGILFYLPIKRDKDVLCCDYYENGLDSVLSMYEKNFKSNKIPDFSKSEFVLDYKDSIKLGEVLKIILSDVNQLKKDYKNDNSIHTQQ